MARNPTSADVARKAGVSRTTVSFVLNGVAQASIPEETRRRVMEAARELDYHPNAVARSLARQRTNTLGLVLCQSPDRLSTDAFLPAVLRGMTSVASGSGFRVLLEAVEDVRRPGTYLSLAREAQIDGIVLSGPRSDDEQLPKLRAARFPVVLIGQLPGSGLPFVDVDNVRAARAAVDHLVRLGHRRIACITDRPLQFTAAADRLRGYRTALEEHGLPFDESLVRYGETKDSGLEAMRSLLAAQQRPSAVFIASDVVALGALEAAGEAHLRVPDDVAIVGFDDIPLAALTSPPLTTVRLPAQDIGATAARMLIDLIETGTAPEPALLKTELIVRRSSGPHVPPRPEGTR